MPLSPTKQASTPQTTMMMLAGTGMTSRQRQRGEIDIHADPAELQDAHQEAGHEKTALGAEGRGADNIERQAGLHAEQARHQVKQEMADEAPR